MVSILPRFQHMIPTFISQNKKHLLSAQNIENLKGNFLYFEYFNIFILHTYKNVAWNPIPINIFSKQNYNILIFKICFNIYIYIRRVLLIAKINTMIDGLLEANTVQSIFLHTYHKFPYVSACAYGYYYAKKNMKIKEMFLPQRSFYKHMHLYLAIYKCKMPICIQIQT